jgi:hypothetical protein
MRLGQWDGPVAFDTAQKDIGLAATPWSTGFVKANSPIPGAAMTTIQAERQTVREATSVASMTALQKHSKSKNQRAGPQPFLEEG